MLKKRKATLLMTVLGVLIVGFVGYQYWLRHLSVLAPIQLAEAGIAESTYWLLAENSGLPPQKPIQLRLHDGKEPGFCISVDFKINPDGRVSDWKVAKIYPPTALQQLTASFFMPLKDWQFQPAPANTEHRAVISNRVFLFNATAAQLPSCFTP